MGMSVMNDEQEWKEVLSVHSSVVFQYYLRRMLQITEEDR